MKFITTPQCMLINLVVIFDLFIAFTPSYLGAIGGGGDYPPPAEKCINADYEEGGQNTINCSDDPNDPGQCIVNDPQNFPGCPDTKAKPVNASCVDDPSATIGICITHVGTLMIMNYWSPGCDIDPNGGCTCNYMEDELVPEPGVTKCGLDPNP
ncbi:hypothetical protein [Gimesia aquarii]|uniref:Uncharacterized protein n=1 Tax=Gimesia aquarii TaxID=2527964 RepID=A0A517VXN2_9PLAN|nr:hypothetical protein [Gimesia aquarii]QDT97762.1 hypothetical protein V144x_32440 [Gimesia aquarii]